MDPAFDRVLNRYRDRMAREAERLKAIDPTKLMAIRDEFLLPVGEEVADLMVDLIVGLGARHIVELGTSYGFSTLYLADAARRTGGRVTTFELSADKQAYARTELSDAGLADFVDWKLGDAVALLADHPGPVDFVLVDLWKNLYVPCFEALYPKLAPNAVLVADNMLFPQRERDSAAAYRAAVRAKPDIEAVLLPIGQGIDIACRVALP